MTAHQPDLRFGPGPGAGFTQRGIAGFSDLRPAAVVRELIQNALDAAVEAKEKTAIVRFKLTSGKTQDIPGIQNYRRAFRDAVASQTAMGEGILPSQASRVVQVIEDALKQDEHDILSVLDNGIGLNQTRMDALLSDGISAKGGDATGTFGNGHSVAIPASDLRYLLYGGLTKDGNRIGAGHAVLASRKKSKEKHQRAADGFFIHDFQDGGGYEYASGSSIPKIIKRDLRDIHKCSSHGSVVIIPGFNNFREEFLLWDMVSKAAASNFFQAIEEDRLVVWVEDLRHREPKYRISLDRATLPQALEKNRDEKRSRAFLSGQKAFEAHEVLQNGERHTVSTGLGEIRIQLLVRSSGSPRIDLCRNGMWISDDKGIPGLRYEFGDRVPFHALLLLDSGRRNRFYELVRNAEGPLHDKLSTKYLAPSERSDLRRAFHEVREWLRSHVPEISDDSYSPHDFLTLDFGEDTDAERGKGHRSFWGAPAVVNRRDPDPWQHSSIDPSGGPAQGSGDGEGTGGKESDGKSARPKSRPVLRSIFQVVSSPNGPNRRRIHLECQESCKNAELRMRVDEYVDVTCDRLRREEIAPVGLGDVKVDGQAIRDSELVWENERVVGIRLGDLASGRTVRIDMSYALPEDLAILPGQEPALRVEVFKASPAPSPDA